MAGGICKINEREIGRERWGGRGSVGWDDLPDCSLTRESRGGHPALVVGLPCEGPRPYALLTSPLFLPRDETDVSPTLSEGGMGPQKEEKGARARF